MKAKCCDRYSMHVDIYWLKIYAWFVQTPQVVHRKLILFCFFPLQIYVALALATNADKSDSIAWSLGVSLAAADPWKCEKSASCKLLKERFDSGFFRVSVCVCGGIFSYPHHPPIPRSNIVRVSGAILMETNKTLHYVRANHAMSEKDFRRHNVAA